MKTIGKIATASAVAFSALAFTANAQDRQTGWHQSSYACHYCGSDTQAGIDCSFTSYASARRTAKGLSVLCYGNTPADDKDPWNTRAQQSDEYSYPAILEEDSCPTISRNTVPTILMNTHAQQFAQATC